MNDKPVGQEHQQSQEQQHQERCNIITRDSLRPPCKRQRTRSTNRCVTPTTKEDVTSTTGRCSSYLNRSTCLIVCYKLFNRKILENFRENYDDVNDVVLIPLLLNLNRFFLMLNLNKQVPAIRGNVFKTIYNSENNFLSGIKESRTLLYWPISCRDSPSIFPENVKNPENFYVFRW